MRFRETEIVELKSIVMDDIKKEIIAFANCDGGTVYVGGQTMAKCWELKMQMSVLCRFPIWYEML